jgi:internalin A
LILISSISGIPVIPTIALPGQPVNNKSFVQLCQNKLSVSIETRKTINLLLKEIGTNNCQVADSKLREVTSLNLHDSQISDLKPLAFLTNLTALDLKGNQISDIKPLANLIRLDILDLDDNQINDVKPLANLIKLKTLELKNNQISDVKPLSSLSNLTLLNLSKNLFTNESCPIRPESICRF